MAARIIREKERRCANCETVKPIAEFRHRSRKPERTHVCKPCDQLRRFWAKVHKTETCWIWVAAHNSDGYGSFDHLKAHVFSWTIHNGRVPDGLCVLHHCDNPPCVRPDHLYCGTKRNNYEDMIQRKRTAGEFLRCQQDSILTPDIVRAAREMYATGRYSHGAIHRILSAPVAAVTLSQAISGITWKHL